MPEYPGWDLPLRHDFTSKGIYPSGPDGSGTGSHMIPVREVAMMHVMEKFTDREDWHSIIFDQECVELWRQEVLAIPDRQFKNLVYTGKMDGLINYDHDFDPGRDWEPWHIKPTGIINDAALDFCVQELRNKATYFKNTGIVPTLDSWVSVAKSDGRISKQLHSALNSIFYKLEADHDAPNQCRGFEDQVRHPIDPSMYPLVYCRTRGFWEECVGFAHAIDQWSGKGKVVPKPFRPAQTPWSSWLPRFYREEPRLYGSENYQWLPANLEFEGDGSVCFTSYINNLHPVKHLDAYVAIQKLITLSIPLWDQCLDTIFREGQDVGRSDKLRRAKRHQTRFAPPNGPEDQNDENWVPRSKDECADIEVPEEQLREKMEDESHFNDELLESLRDDLDSDDDSSENLENGHGFNNGDGTSDAPYHPEFIKHCKWMIMRKHRIPDPSLDLGNLNYTLADGERLIDRFRETGLQIIVKMTSIELTPESPEFSTTVWELAGQANEHICATAIYCLDSQNVSKPTLSFRTETENEEPDYGGYPRHNDYGDFYIGQCLGSGWLEQIYGTELFSGENSCIQSYGNVEMPTGRLLAFPNCFQIRPSPLKLADPTKPGHQRYLILYLVEPSTRIISTANIPPQQMDWYSDSLLGTTSTARREALSKLPPELVMMIPDKKDDVLEASANVRLPAELMNLVLEHFNDAKHQLPMGLDEAKEHRARLMQERQKFHENVDRNWRTHTYQNVEE